MGQEVRHASQGAEQRQRRDGPQDEAQVEVTADAIAAVDLAHGHGEDGVGDHPRDDHVRAHALVVVLLELALGGGGFRDLDAVAQVPQGLVVPGVDVELLRGHLELDDGALAHGAAQVRLHDVVALGAPRDVVRVAEGVHLQHADVAGQQHEVLAEAGEHVPGVEVDEGHEEVQADGGAGRDDQVREHVVAERELRVVLLVDLPDHDVHRREHGVHHDDAVHDHAEEVELLGPLRPVPQRDDELHADEQHADVPQHDEDHVGDAVPERVDLGVREAARDEVEGEVEVGQREEREEELDELVHEFDVQQDLARDRVVGCPYLLEVNEGVNGCEESTVEPSSSLGDEFRNRIYFPLVMLHLY